MAKGLNFRQGIPSSELVVWQLNWLYKLEVQWKLMHFKINYVGKLSVYYQPVQHLLVHGTAIAKIHTQLGNLSQSSKPLTFTNCGIMPLSCYNVCVFTLWSSWQPYNGLENCDKRFMTSICKACTQDKYWSTPHSEGCELWLVMQELLSLLSWTNTGMSLEVFP